jgi:alcohol dehydrogenase
MACGDKKSAAAVAILDPMLTLTQPSSVTSHTGIDALVHAVETMVSRKANETSRAYSRLAFKLLDTGLESVFSRPDDMIARSQVQLGAAYAGTAIENSMLGAAHSAANPLTAHFNLVHGSAVGVMLPHVVRHNAERSPEASAAYSELGYDGGDALAQRVSELLNRARMKNSLKLHGVDPGAFGQLSLEAAGQWTAQFNPVDVDASDFLKLYQAAY